MSIQRTAPLAVLVLLSVWMPSAWAAGRLSQACQVLLAEVKAELEHRVHDPNIIHRQTRNFSIGGAAQALVPTPPTCEPLTPRTAVRKLSAYPRDEVLALLGELEAVGGRLCAGARRAGDLGGFYLGPDDRPILLLANEAMPPAKARGTLHHERAHFHLWRNLRNAIVDSGESPETANQFAERLLISPNGYLFDESNAVLAELRSHGDESPFQDLEEIIYVANYPASQALVHAIVIRANWGNVRPRLSAKLLREHDADIDEYRRQVVERTVRLRAALAQLSLARARRSVADLEAEFRAAVKRDGLTLASIARFPKRLQHYYNYLRLREPPSSLEDFFGNVLHGEPEVMLNRIRAILLPGQAKEEED